MVDKTTEETIQKRDIIVTQIINELGITIETNTKPLIRCKDCKYWKSEYICIGRWGWYGTMMTEADAFCSYGERKDNE